MPEVIDVTVEQVTVDAELVTEIISIEVGGLVGPPGPAGSGSGLPPFTDPSSPDSKYLVVQNTDGGGHPDGDADWEALDNLVGSGTRYFLSDAGSYDTLTTDLGLANISSVELFTQDGEEILGWVGLVGGQLTAQINEPLTGWGMLVTGQPGLTPAAVGSTSGGSAPVTLAGSDLTFDGVGTIHGLPDPTTDDEAANKHYADAGDATNATAIGAEATTRAAADTTLQGNITAEATTRATAISTEASSRIAGDAASVSTAAGDATAKVLTETNRATAAEALLAPKASPTFTGTVTVPDPSTNTGALNRETGDARYDPLGGTATNAALLDVLTQPNAVRGLRANLAKAILSGSAVGFLGDSLVAGGGSNSNESLTQTGVNAWTDKFRRAVGTYLGGAGQNIGWLEAWQTADDATTHVFPYCWGRITGSSTALACYGTPQPTRGTGHAVSASSGTFTPALVITARTIEIYGTVQPGGGTLQLEVDGTLVGSPGSTNSTGGLGGITESGHLIQSFTIPGPLVSHSLRVAHAGGAASIFDAAYITNAASTARVCRIVNMGNGGTGYATYIAGGANTPGPIDTIKNLAVDHLVMCSAFNDIALGKSAAQFTADAKAIIDAVIAVRPNCTFTVCFEPYLNYGPANALVSLSQWLTTWYQAHLDIVAYAKTKTDGHLFNMYKLLGDMATSDPYSFRSPLDALHPNDFAHDILGTELAKELLTAPPHNFMHASGLNPFEGDVDFDQHAVKNAKGTTLLPPWSWLGIGAGTVTARTGELAVIEEVNQGGILGTHLQLAFYNDDTHRLAGNPALKLVNLAGAGAVTWLDSAGAQTAALITTGSGQLKAVDSGPGTSKITAAAGTASTDVVTKSNKWTDMTAPSADVNINTHKLTAVSPGTATTDAANLTQAYGAPLKTACYITAPHANRATLVTTLNRMYVIPIFLNHSITIASLACEATATVSTAVVRLGVYADLDGFGSGPGALLYGGGTQAAATATNVEDTSAAGTVLGAGWNWLAVVGQTAAPTLRSSNAWTHTPAISTLAGVVGANLGIFYLKSAVSGALPSPFSAIGENSASAGPPIVWFKQN